MHATLHYKTVQEQKQVQNQLKPMALLKVIMENCRPFPKALLVSDLAPL